MVPTHAEKRPNVPQAPHDREPSNLFLEAGTQQRSKMQIKESAEEKGGRLKSRMLESPDVIPQGRVCEVLHGIRDVGWRLVFSHGQLSRLLPKMRQFLDLSFGLQHWSLNFPLSDDGVVGCSSRCSTGPSCH